MSDWQQLVTAALIGTERHSAEKQVPPGDVGVLVAALPPQDPEARLLGEAAIVSLYRAAGRRPVRLPQTEEPPCPADDAPTVSSRSSDHLTVMLEGRYRELLPEWLTGVAAARKRVPAEHLPALLEAARTERALRPHVLPVLGQRGNWLALRNPAWSFGEHVPEADAWETGRRDQRAALLEQLRRNDPDGARELLASTWTQETGEDRERFIPALRTGLSPADEPFLEAALDDKRKDVRRTAADLLARLPTSALAARMLARLRPCVRVGRKLLSRVLEVEPPEQCDKEMVRDGIEPKVPLGDRTRGERGWWLQQIVGATPLAFWRGEFGLAPAQLLDLAAKSDWKQVLYDGWAAAAVRQPDPEWIELLLDRGETTPSSTGELIRNLDPQRREAYALRLLQSGRPLDDGRSTLQVLQEITGGWSPELTRAVVRAFRERITLGPGRHGDWQAMHAFKQFGRQAHPSLAIELEAGWPSHVQHWSMWETSVQEFLTTLQFRHEMLQEIQR